MKAASPIEQSAAERERPLAGQVAMVTGGGRGIGRAIAVRFAAAGAAVVCASRTEQELETTVDAISEAGGEALGIVTDVRDRRAVDALVRRTVDRYGGLHLAVLSAGQKPPPARVDEIPVEWWLECVDTNVNGVFHSLQAVMPHLRAAGGGRIIVLGSAAARRAASGLAHYAAANAAVSVLVRVAARDLRRDRIAINELQPGPTATAMHGVLETDPDTLAEREVVLGGEGLEDDQTIAGEWFKSPRNVAEFALYLATLPNHGPSGQIFSYNSPV